MKGRLVVGNVYEIDDGHQPPSIATGWQHARRIATALSAGGTVVIWKRDHPKFMKVFRFGRPARRG